MWYKTGRVRVFLSVGPREGCSITVIHLLVSLLLGFLLEFNILIYVVCACFRLIVIFVFINVKKIAVWFCDKALGLYTVRVFLRKRASSEFLFFIRNDSV